MIKLLDIEQNTPEWFAVKWGKIGGTLSKGLLIASDTLLIDILGRNLEECVPDDDGYESDDMKRGKEMEVFARQYIEQYYGIEFQTPGWLQSEEFSILGISPDGITPDDTIAVETKCLAMKAHTKILFNDEIPSEHLPQCVHYFTVNPKLEKLIYCAFRPESKKHFVRELTLDSIVDLGWKKKVEVKQYGVKGQEIKPKIETHPDPKSIRQWVEESKKATKNLKLELTTALNFLGTGF